MAKHSLKSAVWKIMRHAISRYIKPPKYRSYSFVLKSITAEFDSLVGLLEIVELFDESDGEIVRLGRDAGRARIQHGQLQHSEQGELGDGNATNTYSLTLRSVPAQSPDGTKPHVTTTSMSPFRVPRPMTLPG